LSTGKIRRRRRGGSWRSLLEPVIMSHDQDLTRHFMWMLTRPCLVLQTREGDEGRHTDGSHIEWTREECIDGLKGIHAWVHWDMPGIGVGYT